MLPEQDSVAIFQERRADTWAAGKPWLFLMVVGFIGDWYVGKVDDQTSPRLFVIFLAFFVLLGVAIIRLTFIVKALYRCPVCEEVPMSGWGTFGPGSFEFHSGVDLNPKICPRCGAKLR